MADSRPESQGVPEWMATADIKKGEYLMMTKGQLKTRQRPGNPLKVQVWATGILHTAGYQGERALTMRGGKRVLLTPGDIIKELHAVAKAFYEKGGMELSEEQTASLKESKETMRRCLSDLEEDGVALRTDTAGRKLSEMTPEELKKLAGGGKTILYFYLKPREAAPQTVVEEWEKHMRLQRTKQEEVEVGKNLLHEISINHILKLFDFGKLSKKQLSDPQTKAAFAVAFDAAKQAFVQALEVVKTSSQQVDMESPLSEVDTPAPLEVDTPGGALERKGENIAKHRSHLQAAGIEQSADEGLLPALLSQELARRKLSVSSTLLHNILEKLGKCPVSHFIDFLERRAERGTIGTGLLLYIAEDAAREFDAMCSGVDQEVA